MSSAKIWESLNKEMGGLFFKANDKMKFELELLPFSSVAIGNAMGCFGLPKRRIVQFTGAENSGKSGLCHVITAEVQANDPTCEVLVIDTEQSYDLNWAKKLGVDVDRVRIMSTNDGVEIFTALCGKWNAKTGKKTTQGLMDLIAEKKLNVPLIILDSIADIQPPSEQGRGFDEYEMAPLARFLPKAFRTLRPMVVKANVAMVCVNHLRDDPKGGPPTYPGGRAYRHNIDASIRLHGSTAADGVLFDSNGKKIGHKLICLAEKTRFGSNKNSGEAWFQFDTGFVKQGEEVASLASEFGIVNRPNAQMWEYNGKSIRGREAFAKYLEENPKIMVEITGKIKERKAAGVEAMSSSDEVKAAANALDGNFFADDIEEENGE